MTQSLPKADTAPLGDYVAGGFKLTGWRVLAIVVGFFGTIAAVDFTMIHYARTTLSGEVADHPFEAGLAYDKEIATAQAQNALNWRVDITPQRLKDEQVALAMSAVDDKGKALEGLQVHVTFQAPADAKRDLSTDLTAAEAGHYQGQLRVPAGQWIMVLSLLRDGQRVFYSTSRVKLD